MIIIISYFIINCYYFIIIYINPGARVPALGAVPVHPQGRRLRSTSSTANIYAYVVIYAYIYAKINNI